MLEAFLWFQGKSQSVQVGLPGKVVMRLGRGLFKVDEWVLEKDIASWRVNL